MRRRDRLVIVALASGALARPSLASAQAQPPCSEPRPPRDVTVRVEQPVRPTTTSPLIPAVLTIAWKEPAADRTPPGYAPSAYLIEAGSERGLVDIAATRTAGPALEFSTPMANGAYYVRVRAINPCGTGRPSRELRVRIEGSVERGQPNPLVILKATNATRERLGDRAYVKVTGQVRNGWQAAPASFVRVTGSFEGAGGELGVSATTYVNGTSRRLMHSGLVTDTAIEPGDAACFSIFAEFRGMNVTGLGLVASAEVFGTEPLRGLVELDGSPTRESDEFGNLVLSGRVRNTGQRPTSSTVVWAEAIGDAGQVLDCHGVTVQAAADTTASSPTGGTLSSGEIGRFRNPMEAVATVVRSYRLWAGWDEADQRETAVLTPEYRALRQQLLTLAGGDDLAMSPQEMTKARDALRNEARAIETRLSEAARR